MSNKTIIEFGFRIMEISEGVMHKHALSKMNLTSMEV